VAACFAPGARSSLAASVRRIAATLAVLLTGLCLSASGLAPAALAQAIPCSFAGGYPGDFAEKPQLAAWMATGAIGSGLPGELPVMGALVESGLTNLPAGDADTVGYFQMRESIWNKDDYAGYPENPDLQLRWFVDHAVAVDEARVASGQAPFGPDETQWGEWAADVLRPAQPYRGRYQLRLADARALIVAGCGGPDTTPPDLRVSGRRRQDPLAGRLLVLEASCPVEACVASARGTIASAARTYRIVSRARHIARGGRAKLRLRLKRRIRRALGRALLRRGRLKARIAVTATDAAGNFSRVSRSITLER
jgi:hypothetical protein